MCFFCHPANSVKALNGKKWLACKAIIDVNAVYLMTKFIVLFVVGYLGSHSVI